MRLGKDIEQASVDVEFGCIQIGAREAVGFKRLPASHIQPWMKSGWLGKKCLQKRFMISTQAHSAFLNNAPCQRFDHILRLRTTVDIIADIDFNRCSHRTAGPIIVNSPDNVAQQVGAAMNIADGIDSDIGRKGRV